MANEILIPIPGRLHSVATEGHGLGADEVYDDNLGITLDQLSTKHASTGTTGDYPYNGMGRILLKKNMVNEVCTLTQSMMQATNTIYVIQYDFTLGEDITVPANCVLEFDGGSVSGSKNIEGNATKIKAIATKIFGLNVTFTGYWTVDCLYPEWFGAVGDGVIDDTAAFLKTVSVSMSTQNLRGFEYIVAKGTYLLTDTINISSRSVLDGNNSGRLIFDISEEDKKCVELSQVGNSKECCIKNIQIYNKKDHKGYGVYCHRASCVENCYITNFNYGIALVSYGIECVNNTCSNNNVNIGIASANLTSGSVEQTNDITVNEGYCGDSVSGYNIKIGNTPWAAEPQNYRYGHQIVISNVGLDNGCMSVENIQNVSISNCYFEHNESSNHNGIGLYIGKGAQGISVSNSWFHIFEYGIFVDAGEGIYINNNNFGGITKVLVYFVSTPVDMDCRDNYAEYNPASFGGYNSYHFGIKQSNTTLANRILKHIRESFVNLYKNVCIFGDFIRIGSRLARISNNYFTKTDRSLILAGRFVNETVDNVVNHYFYPTNSLNTEPIPGLNIEGHDCYISRVDYENSRILLFSPTDDYPYSGSGEQAGTLTSKLYTLEDSYFYSDAVPSNVERSGKFADKPNSSDIFVGYSYFCTNLKNQDILTPGIPIYHRGNDIWCDAVGRILGDWTQVGIMSGTDGSLNEKNYTYVKFTASGAKIIRYDFVTDENPFVEGTKVKIDFSKEIGGMSVRQLKTGSTRIDLDSGSGNSAFVYKECPQGYHLSIFIWDIDSTKYWDGNVTISIPAT